MPRTKKKTRKKHPSKRKPSKRAAKRRVQPDDKLAAIVGSQPLSRPELTKKLWAYIKGRGSANKRRRTTIEDSDLLGASSKRKLSKYISKHTSDSSGTDSPGPGRAW